MILIISNEDEPTTDFVIDWLNYYNQPFVRISVEEKLLIKKIYELNGCFEAVFEYQKHGKTICVDTKEIDSYKMIYMSESMELCTLCEFRYFYTDNLGLKENNSKWVHSEGCNYNSKW